MGPVLYTIYSVSRDSSVRRIEKVARWSFVFLVALVVAQETAASVLPGDNGLYDQNNFLSLGGLGGYSGVGSTGIPFGGIGGPSGLGGLNGVGGVKGTGLNCQQREFIEDQTIKYK